MSDPSSSPQLSDDEIARRLADLEASIADETPPSSPPVTAPRALLGDDDGDDASLDYLRGASSVDASPLAAEKPASASRPATSTASTSQPESLIAVSEEQAAPGGSGMPVTPMTNPILDRAIGVARFAPRYYDAIAADPKATAEAALVVAIVAVAGGIGGLRHGIDGFLMGVIVALVKWGLLAVAANAVLPRFAPGASRDGIAPLARTLGYAQGPRVLAIAGLIPLIGWSLALVGSVWVILTSIVAIRQTAKVGFYEAAIVTVVGWAIATVVAVILALIFGIGLSAVL